MALLFLCQPKVDTVIACISNNASLCQMDKRKLCRREAFIANFLTLVCKGRVLVSVIRHDYNFCNNKTDNEYFLF